MNGEVEPRTAVLADGRRLHAVQPTPLEPWTVWIDDERADAQSGRWLLSLLARVFEVGTGKAPPWIFALVDEILGVDTPIGRRYPCPCCDYLTLTDWDAHQICPVCGWEDDLVQHREPDYRGGANKPSLIEARERYATHGYADAKSAGRVRAPFSAELPPT